MPSPKPAEDHLKLAAFDLDDLSVISAHLQDAIVKVGDLIYLPERGRFGLVARRFDWEAGPRDPRRRLSRLHFDRVLGCRSRGIDRGRPEEVLSLLAVTFSPSEEPSGTATLVFSGGGTIELQLECVEAQMKDLGPVWAASGCPAHDLESA